MNWTTADIAYLTEHATDGVQALARALGRSETSVKMKASRLGISLMYYAPLAICPRCGRETTKMVEHQGYCNICKREIAIMRHRSEIARLRRRQTATRKAELAEKDELFRIARNLRKEKCDLKKKK